MSTDTPSETVQEHQAEQVEWAAESAEQNQSPQSDIEQPYSSRHDHASELSYPDEMDEGTDDTGSDDAGAASPGCDTTGTDELRADDRESAGVAIETAADITRPERGAESDMNTPTNRQSDTRSAERERLEQSNVAEPESNEGNPDSTTAPNVDQQVDDSSEHATENDGEPGRETDPVPITAEDPAAAIDSTGMSEADEVDDELSATTSDDRVDEWAQSETEDLRSTDESVSEILDTSLARDTADVSDIDDGAVQPSDVEHGSATPGSRNRAADDDSAIDKTLSFVNEVLHTQHGLNAFRWFDENVFGNYSRPPEEKSVHLYQRTPEVNLGETADSGSVRSPNRETVDHPHDHEIALRGDRLDSTASVDGGRTGKVPSSSADTSRVHGEPDKLQDSELDIDDDRSAPVQPDEDDDQQSAETAEALSVVTSSSDLRCAEDGAISPTSAVDFSKGGDFTEPTSEAVGESTEAREVETKYGNKITKQMQQRGWTPETVDETIRNPHRTVETIDERRRKDGTRNNDPATAYLNDDDSYVVRNNKTGDIVQVSDRTDPDWRSNF
ncbi:MAG: colicin E5-related ribonuclease [Pseudonocardiaceae bacterium]